MTGESFRSWILSDPVVNLEENALLTYILTLSIKNTRNIDYPYHQQIGFKPKNNISIIFF